MSVQPQFIFGGDTGVSSPEELARLRAISMALSQPAAPKNVGEGLSALGQALGYRLMQSKMGKMQAEGNASASDAISQALNGGTFPAAPGGGASPVASALSGPPADGAAPSQSASSGPPSDIEAYIRQSAAARGIDPDVAVTVAKSEGGLKDPTRQSLARKNGVQEPSYGPFQLLVGGGQTGFPAGMGNQALAAGIDPRDPANWQKGVDFALDQAKQKGWGQWYGAKAAGITGMHGIGNAPIAAAAPQQVASLDPSVGMPAAPSPVAAALQLPQQGPIPQGRPDVAAALNGAPPANGPAALPDAQFNNRFAGLPMMGGPAMPAGPVAPAGMAPMPQPGVDPSTTAAMAPGAVPPLPAREIGPDPMGAAPAQVPQAQPAPDNLPVMAGGSADAIAPGQGGPSIEQLMQAAQNPWLKPEQRQLVNVLLQQKMQQQDPANQLDLEYKRAQLDALKAKPDQTPESVRALNLRAQAAGLVPGTPEYKDFMIKGGGAGTTVNVDTGTIPAGYQAVRDDQGRVLRYEAIPGGPADTTASDAAKSENQSTSSDVITGAANKIRTLSKNPTATGLAGALASNLANTDAAEVYRQVDVLKSNATIENLNAMRAASKTGGALGNVTQGEGEMLAAKTGALDPKSPHFQQQLDDYERTLLRVVHGKEAGDKIFEQSKVSDGPPKPGTVEDGYRFKGGDPADQKNWEPVQ